MKQNSFINQQNSDLIVAIYINDDNEEGGDVNVWADAYYSDLPIGSFTMIIWYHWYLPNDVRIQYSIFEQYYLSYFVVVSIYLDWCTPSDSQTGLKFLDITNILIFAKSYENTRYSIRGVISLSLGVNVWTDAQSLDWPTGRYVFPIALLLQLVYGYNYTLLCTTTII